MKDQIQYNNFNYEDPISFARENVTYILVVSQEKNYNNVKKMHDCILAGQKFLPQYMEKLEKYTFKETYVYTPEMFEQKFVKKRNLKKYKSPKKNYPVFFLINLRIMISGTVGFGCTGKIFDRFSES